MPLQSERERIPQDVTDIGSVSQLLRYALAGQLERLRSQRADVSQAKIAEAAGLSGNRRNAAASLSHALRDGPTAQQLVKLDQVISTLALNVDGIGGLSSLIVRLGPDSGEELTDHLTATVPPHWTGRILRDPASSELDVLVQASALLSAFLAADRIDSGRSVANIRERYSAETRDLVRRLILISAGPPTPRNADAQVIIGGLASYAFDQLRDQLELAVRYSPLAFRVWRSISKLVILSRNGEHTAELRAWVRQLVSASGELRKRSIYAGRSLDLELALDVPASWSPPGDDWAGAALRARAWDNEATIRERGTAAMGMWQRALADDREVGSTEAELRGLIGNFRDPRSRPDAAAGLRWIAATLEQAIDERVIIGNDWPDIDESWFRHVQQAASELEKLGIPDHLTTGTKNLFLHMLLQNAAVYRRRALETLVTSGWHRPVAQALGLLLRTEREEAWLRIRAEFALSFLQRPDEWVEADLTRACLDAYRDLRLGELADDAAPPRARVSELHAALFAVGDCFGVAGAEERAESARERLGPVLADLAAMAGERALILRRPARAAAYLLTVTARPRAGDGRKDVSEQLLERLSEHPDVVTARLSQWALSFRFASDGSVRPLLDAAAHGKQDDSPY